MIIEQPVVEDEVKKLLKANEGHTADVPNFAIEAAIRREQIKRRELCNKITGKLTKKQLDKIMEKYLDYCRICPTYEEMKELVAWAISCGARFDV